MFVPDIAAIVDDAYAGKWPDGQRPSRSGEVTSVTRRVSRGNVEHGMIEQFYVVFTHPSGRTNRYQVTPQDLYVRTCLAMFATLHQQHLDGR